MNEQNGIITTIRKNLGLYNSFNHSAIENVLHEVVLCYTNDTKFDPQALEHRGGKIPHPTHSVSTQWKQR